MYPMATDTHYNMLIEWCVRNRYVDNNAVKFVQGAVKETTALLEERFDHIFYTGTTMKEEKNVELKVMNKSFYSLKYG